MPLAGNEEGTILTSASRTAIAAVGAALISAGVLTAGAGSASASADVQAAACTPWGSGWKCNNKTDIRVEWDSRQVGRLYT